MIHLRIVAPEDVAHQALEVLEASPAVLNIVHLHGAALKPEGDVILLVSGVHGFEVLEELEMIEVKQGPYAGEGDKTRITPAPGDSIRVVQGNPTNR